MEQLSNNNDKFVIIGKSKTIWVAVAISLPEC
jgi:hypothetical protein